MWYLYYGDELVHDVLSDTDKAMNVKLSGEVNEFSTLNFTLPTSNRFYRSISLRDFDKPITLMFNDDIMFRGYAEQRAENTNLTETYVCKSDIAMLNDVILPPYTTSNTDSDHTLEYIGGNSFAALFKWYIDTYNTRVTRTAVHNARTFKIAYPPNSSTNLVAEGAKLDAIGDNYRSSKNKPTVFNEIKTKICDALDAYVFVWYDGTQKCIALFADMPASFTNGQTITFGKNMTAFEFKEESDNIYTVIRPEGAYDSNNVPITLRSIKDGNYGGYYKRDDCLYDAVAAAKYGYRELAVSDSTAKNVNTLLQLAITKLAQVSYTRQTMRVDAVDLAYVDNTYVPMNIGQSIAVQSEAHNIDTILMLMTIAIDLDSPKSTKYTFGSRARKLSRTYSAIMSDISTNRANIASTAGSTAANLDMIKSLQTVTITIQQG